MTTIVLIIALAVCYIVTAICYTINNQYIDDYSEVMTSPHYIDLQIANDRLEETLNEAKVICSVTIEAVKKTHDVQNKQALYDLALSKIKNL